MLPGMATPMLIGAKTAVVTSAWNPLDKSSNFTLSNSNKTATTTSSSSGGVRSTLSKGSGLLYFEAQWTGGGTSGTDGIGLIQGSDALSEYPGATISTGFLLNKQTGKTVVYARSGTGLNNLATPVDGSWVGIHVNHSVRRAWFTINGTIQNSGDPAANTNGMLYDASLNLFPFFASSTASQIMTLNTGSSPFQYTPASGYSAWG